MVDAVDRSFARQLSTNQWFWGELGEFQEAVVEDWYAAETVEEREKLHAVAIGLRHFTGVLRSRMEDLTRDEAA